MTQPADPDPLATCPTPCPIERGMRLIGGKWKASILWHLRDGPVRFNAICRHLSGASKKMIAARLSELEASGLVTREVVTRKPIAVRYALTPAGRSVLDVLQTLHDWSDTRFPAPDGPVTE